MSVIKRRSDLYGKFCSVTVSTGHELHGVVERGPDEDVGFFVLDGKTVVAWSQVVFAFPSDPEMVEVFR